MTVDIFYNTGFDIVNIPCNPELLYNQSMFPYHRIFHDVNLVQSDWLASITLEDDELNWNRDADYVIITDEDKKTRTCYTVDHYEMLSDNVCKFYLVLDPYNTAGGAEPVTIDGVASEPIIVLDASAERISVPLYSKINGQPGSFLQADDNEFFTQPEPFSPAGRLHMHYDAVPMPEYNPPTPPGPTPTVKDWENFRYPTNNVATGTVGFTKPNSGTYANQYIMAGSVGAPTMSIRTTAGDYQDIEVLSALPGTYPSATVFQSKSEYYDAVFNNLTYNYQYIISQVNDFSRDHQMIFDDITSVILPFVAQYITNKAIQADEGTRTDYELYIRPHYITDALVDNYIIQNGTGDSASMRLSATTNPPFNEECLYYNLKIKLPSGGTHYYAVKRDGTWIQIS